MINFAHCFILGAPQNLVGGSPVFPPTQNPSSSISAAASAKVSIEQLVPDNMNSSVVLAAAISVPLTVIVAVCLACRRCRKRGKGTMVGSTNKSKFKDWNVGDILRRNKDGFQPVNTEERDGMLDDDSDSEVSDNLDIMLLVSSIVVLNNFKLPVTK